jgi:hypothetical protein
MLSRLLTRYFYPNMYAVLGTYKLRQSIFYCVVFVLVHVISKQTFATNKHIYETQNDV